MNHPNGIHPLTREQYDAETRVNFSTLKHIAKSPAHYQEAKRNPLKPGRDVLTRGRATHLALFEPEKFLSDCATFDKPRRGKEWDVFAEENAGKELLTRDMYESAVGVADAVRSCEMAQPYLRGAQLEVTVLHDHVVADLHGIPGYRVECKSRLDSLLFAAIADLKSCKDASPEAFGRQCFNLDGYVQAAWYVDAVKAATGRDVEYVWIASEATAPYVTQVYVAEPDLLQMGRERYMGWLDRLNVCRESDEWPGYAAAPMALVLPPWAHPSDDESDLSGLGLTFAEGGA